MKSETSSLKDFRKGGNKQGKSEESIINHIRNQEENIIIR